MYAGFHVKCPSVLGRFNETWLFSTDFRKILNVKFHENPFSVGPAVPRIMVDGCWDRQDEPVTFRNFANGPSKGQTILNSMVASIPPVSWRLYTTTTPTPRLRYFHRKVIHKSRQYLLFHTININDTVHNKYWKPRKAHVSKNLLLWVTKRTVLQSLTWLVWQKCSHSN